VNGDRFPVFRGLIRSAKPGDLILALILLAAGLWGMFNTGDQGRNNERALVQVVTAGGVTRTLPADTTAIIRVKGPLGVTVVHVRDGKAWIASSPCPRKLCVKQGKVDEPGRPVVCIPNGVLVQVIGRAKQVDATTR